ncbi:MAG: hypothetical protein ABWX93_11625 [Pseudoxanthomonas sp.]
MKTTALFIALFALVFAATAQTPAPATSPAPADATALGPDAIDRPVDKDVPMDRNCLKETGSHIAPATDPKGRKCVNAAGRAYDRADIDRTGAIDLRDALRKLDPALN